MRKWRWLIWLVVSIVLVSCNKGPSPTAEWVSYRNEEYHFSFDYPEVWALSEGPEWTWRHGEGLASLNNQGRSPFWLTEQEMAPNSREYGPRAFLKQLSSGGVYLEVGLSYGPMYGHPENYGPEMEADDLSSLMHEVNWETQMGELHCYQIRFDKWGRPWNLVAYLREPVQEEDRSTLERIFNTFRFDSIPIGDELWAIGEARKELPTQINPENFPYVAAVMGRNGRCYESSAERQGDEVFVSFGYVWGLPATGDVCECVPERCHQWLFRVTAKGEVIFESESGATPPEL